MDEKLLYFGKKNSIPLESHHRDPRIVGKINKILKLSTYIVRVLFFSIVFICIQFTYTYIHIRTYTYTYI